MKAAQTSFAFIALSSLLAFASASSPAFAGALEKTAALEANNTVQTLAVARPVVRIVDPAVNDAVNFIIESQKANERRNRRKQIKPAADTKVVQDGPNNNVLILGGSDTIPM